jgi:hypothetical protein
MLMRKLLVVLGPLLLCLLTCTLFRWLDAMVTLGSFFQFALKGALLGVCVALLLPIAGIACHNTGLTGWLFVTAALLLVILTLQYLDTAGTLRWPLLRAVLGVNGQVVLAESTVLGFTALTAALNVNRRG